MRVLVFGGSFDPPHRGHAALLSSAAKRIRPDRITIVPAYQAPLKGVPTATAKDRAILVKKGILERLPARWKKIAKVDLTEIHAKRQVYSYETLRRIEGEKHFVVGSDSAVNFSRWKNPNELKKSATWWHGARPGAKRNVPSHFRLIPGKFPNISSTEIRSALALGQDCSKVLFPSVLSYIQNRRLYGLSLLARLRATLSSNRYEHTLNVATLAESLARRHGADPDKARLAGLLHDAGRRFSPPALATLARKRRFAVPELAALIAREPMLLHAHASEDLARREFGVSDPEVLAAIRRHTLGDRSMTLLDRVLYAADACSSDRTHSDAAKTRALAFEDLEAAVARCAAAKLRHALARGAWLHPLTVSLWNSLSGR